MSDVSPGIELANMMADLSVLKPQLAARRGDLQAERFGTATHSYAVDTNILYFIGQPVTKILSQEKLDRAQGFQYRDRRRQVPHIGSVFRTDERHYHLAIGASLAQFIGFSLAGTSPLLLPDALWPEAATMLANFSSLDDAETLRLADDLFRELEARTISKLEDRLRAVDLEPSHLAEPLRAKVRQKIGRHKGLDRLEMLFEGGAIEQLSARPMAGVNYLAALTGQGQRFEDVRDELRQREQAVYDKWDRALTEVGKSEPHKHLDAQALTQIELRNLAAQQGGSSERTLYVTVDALVILAAETIEVEHLGCSFAEAFVRHPAAFLNDIGLGVGRTSAISEVKSDSEAVSILDWIDVMLSHSAAPPPLGASKKAAEDWARNAVSEIRTGWRELSDLQEDQLFFQFGIEQIEQSLHEQLEGADIAMVIARLRDEVIEEEARAWEHCFRVAIHLALHVQPQDYQRPTRSSPPICFEGWPLAGEAIEQFKIWGARGLSSRADYEAESKQLEGGEDRSGYAYYLASSAFFAARGDWAPAAGLASFARERAFLAGVDDRRGANGREACYLEAVARRHLVRNSAELARARELIEECETIFAAEKERARVSLDIVPERFALELLDIDQTELLFRWDAEQDFEDVRSAMTMLLGRYRDIQVQLQRQVDLRLLDKTPMLLGSEAYVLVQTEVRTIISALLLVSVGEIPLDDSVRPHLRRFLDRLPRLHKAASSKRRGPLALAETQDGSVLAEVAVTVVSTLLARAAGQRPDRHAIREARRALDQKVLKSHRTFPFDARRFDRMRDMLADRSPG